MSENENSQAVDSRARKGDERGRRWRVRVVGGSTTFQHVSNCRTGLSHKRFLYLLTRLSVVPSNTDNENKGKHLLYEKSFSTLKF